MLELTLCLLRTDPMLARFLKNAGIFVRVYIIAKKATNKSIKPRMPLISDGKAARIAATAPCDFDSSATLFPLWPTSDTTGWLEAGEARCKPVRVDGIVRGVVHLE